MIRLPMSFCKSQHMAKKLDRHSLASENHVRWGFSFESFQLRAAACSNLLALQCAMLLLHLPGMT